HAGDPEIGTEEGIHTSEAIRRDAHDRIHGAIDVHSTTDDADASEPPLTESITDNGDGPCVGSEVFLRQEGASRDSTNAEDVEVIPRDHLDKRLLWLALGREAHRQRKRVRRETREHLVLIPEVTVVGT